jgi:hypothetical protein
MTVCASDMSSERERRLRRRHRVLLGGIVTHNEGAHSFGCTIRNQTDAGALITLPKGRCLPPNIYLINLRERIAYEALTVWTDGRVAGLAFLESVPLAEMTDPKLSYLNEIWSGHSTRREAAAEFI